MIRLSFNPARTSYFYPCIPPNILPCDYCNISGVCGYATTVGNCTVMTVQQFCANSALNPLAFNGGLSAAPQGNLGLLVLAL
jgi:hypothetical protein